MSLSLPDLLRSAFSRCGLAWFAGEIKGYCHTPTCPARQVRIWVKMDPEEHPISRQMVCPLCSKPLEVDYVHTLAEHEDRHREEARWSVRHQLEIKRRQQDHPGGLVLCSLAGDPIPGLDDEVRL